MSEVSTRVKNNPSGFSKATDITKPLAPYVMNGKEQPHILPPKIKPSFDFGGTGGVPVYYNPEEKKTYIDQTDKHTMVFGSTASKKSRLVAMPTVMILAAAKESMIISDPKAEIYLRTASFLSSQGYNVQVLNLREPQYGSAWNPLYIPYLLYKAGEIDRAYEFANDIAVNLTNIDKSKKEAFWDNSAGSFFFGLILLLFKYCSEHDLPIDAVSIGNIIALRNSLVSGTDRKVRNNPLWNYAKSDPFISSILIGTIETANDTRAGILSTFDEKIRAFSIQPSLLAMLSQNDFNYDSLRNTPTAFFLIMPDEKTGYHSLASLFIKQSYEYLIFETQQRYIRGDSIGLRINYILDEFSSLPTISDFPAMITAARSRNIRFNLFLQSLHQLKLRYQEESETIMSNCENWFFLASRELELLREFSELCGTVGGNTSKPLLSVTDLQRLDKDAGEVLILSGRNKPFISQLADIDLYEPPSYRPEIYKQKQQYSGYDIDFSKTPLATALPSIFEPMRDISDPLAQSIDLDDMIKHLDAKIKELEEQERSESHKETEEESKGDVDNDI